MFWKLHCENDGFLGLPVQACLHGSLGLARPMSTACCRSFDVLLFGASALPVTHLPFTQSRRIRQPLELMTIKCQELVLTLPMVTVTITVTITVAALSHEPKAAVIVWRQWSPFSASAFRVETQKIQPTHLSALARL